MHGLLNLHKPAGVTSRAVVNQVQRLVRPAKIGHTGTLDPLATGVLVVCIGVATRLTEYVQQMRKGYKATFVLGKRSDTDDVDGIVAEISNAHRPSQGEIEQALRPFVGAISQRPPDFSAVKIQGKRAYALARQGESVAIAERTVQVHALRLVRYDYPVLQLEIECGSGTYVRSLGRDLAKSLGTAAVMSQLCRTAVGPFHVSEAIDPDSLNVKSIPAALLPLETAVQHLPQVQLEDVEVQQIQFGRSIERRDHCISADAAAFDPRGRLVAILTRLDDDLLRPDKVLMVSN